MRENLELLRNDGTNSVVVTSEVRSLKSSVRSLSAAFDNAHGLELANSRVPHSFAIAVKASPRSLALMHAVMTRNNLQQ